VAGEGLASPSGGGGLPLEADLVMAGGAAIVVWVALEVSSWNGGRRLWGGVFHLRDAGRLGSACGSSWWTSIWSGSKTGWLSSTAGAARGAGGGGRSGQSRLLAVTGLFLSNENTKGPAVDLLALVLREASRDRR